MHHIHFVGRITNLKKIPYDPKELDAWLVKLVEVAGMEILGDHQPSIRCDDEGNEGCTGTIRIKTSHASIHVWDKETVPFAMVDLYSCRDFDSIKIMEHCAVFEPDQIDGMVLDRNDFLPKIILTHKFIF